MLGAFMFSKLAYKLDEISASLEERGFKKEAEELDVLANTLEKLDMDRLREKLKEEGYLGLDTMGEALGEILKDKDWKKRWDVDEELAGLGDAYRKSKGLPIV